MKILYAASEATPFAKSGGLADVAGSLPKALVKDGVDARVIMPLYGDLKFRDRLEYVTNYSVPVGWRSQYCGLFKAEVDGFALRCAWLRCGRETKRVAVIVHGFGSRYEHVLKYAKLYTARGYDALLFDHRHCGESEGTKTTMGYLERRDLMQMIALRARTRAQARLWVCTGNPWAAPRCCLPPVWTLRRIL